MNLPSTALAAAIISLFFALPAFGTSDEEVRELREEIRTIKAEYEDRILRMEQRLAEMEAKKTEDAKVSSKDYARRPSGAKILNNDFNPSIGIILGGRYASFSSGDGSIPGFALDHEGERGKEGISLGETEFNFSANVDDKFRGSTTVALAEDDETEVELEEAYFESLPGLGLPTGASVKAGRAFWTLGYMNEHHSHADDFADRPLPYRVFLDRSFNDTGAQVSYVLPTELYSEVGGGIFRGDDFPFAGASGEDINSWSAFLRVGGDLGANSSWRIGGYILDGKAEGRGGHPHEEDDEEHEEDETASAEEFFSEGAFTGDTRLYAVDLRYTWAPTGNARQSELLFLAEYFRRSEKGTYFLDEDEGSRDLDGSAHGWYAQGVYKFAPSLRAGVRYSRLHSPKDAELSRDPYAVALMGDWTNSEFSRLRLQYNRENLEKGRGDNQFLIQYVMSVGAHGAHKY